MAHDAPHHLNIRNVGDDFVMLKQAYLPFLNRIFHSCQMGQERCKIIGDVIDVGIGFAGNFPPLHDDAFQIARHQQHGLHAERLWR